MKFRKKPVVVEAWLFTGWNLREAPTWAQAAATQLADISGDVPLLGVRTLEGRMKASPGDWLIRGIKGEVYPCKPDIFEATYEPVE